MHGSRVLFALAVYKSRTGYKGTGTSGRVCGDLGHETRDLRTPSVRRGDVWDGDVGTSNIGTQGMRDVNDYRKSRR